MSTQSGHLARQNRSGRGDWAALKAARGEHSPEGASARLEPGVIERLPDRLRQDDRVNAVRGDGRRREAKPVRLSGPQRLVERVRKDHLGYACARRDCGSPRPAVVDDCLHPGKELVMRRSRDPQDPPGAGTGPGPGHYRAAPRGPHRVAHQPGTKRRRRALHAPESDGDRRFSRAEERLHVGAERTRIGWSIVAAAVLLRSH